MTEYVEWLRDQDREATPSDPMPAVDAIRSRSPSDGLLVRLSLQHGRNPRLLARMFYEASGQ